MFEICILFLTDPVWASVELGIVVCEDCMTIHKSLTKATFKSVLCQDWTEENLNVSKSNQKSIQLLSSRDNLQVVQVDRSTGA